MKQFLILFTVLVMMSSGPVHGQGTAVTPGVLNALKDAIVVANSGDVLTLAADGLYENEGSIAIDKDLTIMGMGTIADGNLPYIKDLVSTIPKKRTKTD